MKQATAIISPSQIDDEAAKAAVEAYLAKFPKAKLFIFEAADKLHVGKRVPLQSALAIATAMSGKKADDGALRTFIQINCLHPKYGYEDLDGLGELTGGEVMDVLNGLLGGNGIGESTVKNLYGRPGSGGAETTTTDGVPPSA